ncbi:single-stranded DNA-binding protein [Geodermatophilus sp. SYSU D00815]
MKETEVTVVGNVVGPPQKNRTANGSVTNFRLASTSRRFDKGVQGWVDSKTLFLDVECWGELGGNVSHTISKGDPVIVFGWLFTDEWESDQGRRSKVKLRAAAVGPDLNKGTADFRRTLRAAPAADAPPGEEPPGEEPPGEEPPGDEPGAPFGGFGDVGYEVDTGEEARTPVAIG